MQAALVHTACNLKAARLCHIDAEYARRYGCVMPKNAIRLFVLLFVTACKQPNAPALPEGGLTTSRFVDVMTNLAVSDRQMHMLILEQNHTSEAEIRAFVAALSADPVLLSATLDSVQNRVERARMLKPAKTIE